MYTSLAVIDINGGRFLLREKLAKISLDELQSMTGAALYDTENAADLIMLELT